jgi:hypothetical protein
VVLKAASSTGLVSVVRRFTRRAAASTHTGAEICKENIFWDACFGVYWYRTSSSTPCPVKNTCDPKYTSKNGLIKDFAQTRLLLSYSAATFPSQRVAMQESRTVQQGTVSHDLLSEASPHQIKS